MFPNKIKKLVIPVHLTGREGTSNRNNEKRKLATQCPRGLLVNLHILNRSLFCFDGTIGNVSKSLGKPGHIDRFDELTVCMAMRCCASVFHDTRNLSGTLTLKRIKRMASWTARDRLRSSSESCGWSDRSRLCCGSEGAEEMLMSLWRDMALGYCVAMLTPDQ